MTEKGDIKKICYDLSDVIDKPRLKLKVKSNIIPIPVTQEKQVHVLVYIV